MFSCQSARLLRDAVLLLRLEARHSRALMLEARAAAAGGVTGITGLCAACNPPPPPLVQAS